MRRIGPWAEAVRKNATTFLDGARFGRSLQAPAGRNAVEPTPEGPLSRYIAQHTEGPGIWKWEHYLPIYERHFGRFVGQEAHVVEVGIYKGGSLSMWLDYFGADAHIYGVDIQEACRKYASDRISVFIGDQSDPAFWRDFLRAVPRIDILIDDGSHLADHQITTLKWTLPAISPGGVYLCEDILSAVNEFHGFVEGLSRRLHSPAPEPVQQHIASIHQYPFVTVIEKPTLPVERLAYCSERYRGAFVEDFMEHGWSVSDQG